MLRCLTIRCLVARHTDDGDARYSSVRQLSHASSEHDTLGQTLQLRLLPGWDRITAAGQEPAGEESRSLTHLILLAIMAR